MGKFPRIVSVCQQPLRKHEHVERERERECVCLFECVVRELLVFKPGIIFFLFCLVLQIIVGAIFIFWSFETSKIWRSASLSKQTRGEQCPDSHADIVT